MQRLSLPTIRLVPALLVALLLLPSTALADRGRGGGGGGGDDRREVRTSGTCGGRATAKLKAKERDGGIEVEFEVEHVRTAGLWRIVMVQEGRVAWRGRVRTRGSRRSFGVEHRIANFPGADRIMVRGLGPRGITCVASATLPG
jgi:hypothetical protein